MAPAASGYAYGSRRRSAAAAEEAPQEEEEDGWADEARGSFREHEGRRRTLVDGKTRSCRILQEHGLVTVAQITMPSMAFAVNGRRRHAREDRSDALQPRVAGC